MPPAHHVVPLPYPATPPLPPCRSLGDLDFKEPGRYVEAEPDVARVELSSGDEFLLLASDGLWDVLSDQEACDVARQVLQVGRSGDAVCFVSWGCVVYCCCGGGSYHDVVCCAGARMQWCAARALWVHAPVSPLPLLIGSRKCLITQPRACRWWCHQMQQASWAAAAPVQAGGTRRPLPQPWRRRWWTRPWPRAPVTT
jgi:hypothetical protein